MNPHFQQAVRYRQHVGGPWLGGIRVLAGDWWNVIAPDPETAAPSVLKAESKIVPRFEFEAEAERVQLPAGAAGS